VGESNKLNAWLRIRIGAACFAGLIGAVVLIGWASGHVELTRVVAGLSAMNPMTAVSLIALGAALLLRPRRDALYVRLLCSVAIFVGSAKLAQLSTGWSFGVDELLFQSRLGSLSDVPPNRMAPNTALALALAGLALLLSGARSHRLKLASHAVAMVVSGITLFAIIGYVLGLAALYEVSTFNAMALHAAASLLAISIGVLAVNPRIGIMAILADQGPAGTLARTALPVALMVPVLVGLFRLSGESAGFYGTDDGIAIQVFANVLVTFALLITSLVMLHRSDRQRRERELAVARSEEHYRIAERIGRVGHWRMEFPSGRLIWSDEYREICGMAKDAEPSIDAVLNLYLPEDAAAARAEMEQASTTGTGWEASRRLVRPDGEFRHIKSHSVCERDEDGNLTALFGVVLDVTDLELARRQAEAASATKAAFLANMSHEIRTPMNGVMGFAELLLATPLQPEQKRHASLILDSARSLLKLLNDILDVSKIDAGQLEVVSEPFSLRHGIRQCVDLMLPMASQKGLTLTATMAPDVPVRIVGDGLRLRQILLNLIGNAVKFTSHGSVTVEARRGQSDNGEATLVVSVCDTGVGIAEERLAAVFEEFVQADPSISRRFGGSGLGLSISRRLADLMGGRIALCRREGGGTEATVILPLIEASEEEPAAASLLPGGGFPNGDMRPASILLVEDIDINRELVTTLLTRMGHMVEVAENGAVALAKAAELAERPDAWDLILMDVQMPVMDGLTATRAIRALGGRAASVPIVALSAGAFASDIQDCRDAGMNDHVAKPIVTADLVAAIKRWARPTERRAAPSPEAEAVSAEFLSRFAERRRSSAGRLQELRAQLTGADALLLQAVLGEAVQVAHVIAGTAGMFGDAPLGRIASEVEQELAAARTQESAEAAFEPIRRLSAALEAKAA
jgi:signal transduction histidine kinase/DNA-binding response OmpR family regulator